MIHYRVMGKRLTEHLDYLSFIRVLQEFCDCLSCDGISTHNIPTSYITPRGFERHELVVELVAKWLLCASRTGTTIGLQDYANALKWPLSLILPELSKGWSSASHFKY